jgi:hypothetical protein
MITILLLLLLLLLHPPLLLVRGRRRRRLLLQRRHRRQRLQRRSRRPLLRFLSFFFFSFSEILNFKLFIYFGFVSGSCDFVITDILFDKILLAFFHQIKLGRFCEIFVFKYKRE